MSKLEEKSFFSPGPPSRLNQRTERNIWSNMNQNNWKTGQWLTNICFYLQLFAWIQQELKEGPFKPNTNFLTCLVAVQGEVTRGFDSGIPAQTLFWFWTFRVGYHKVHDFSYNWQVRDNNNSSTEGKRTGA